MLGTALYVDPMVRFYTENINKNSVYEFTKFNIQVLIQSIIVIIKDERITDTGVVLAHDGDADSKKVMQWVAEVFVGNGVTCYLIEEKTTTDIINFAIKYYEMPWGLMITKENDNTLCICAEIPTIKNNILSNTQLNKIKECMHYIGENDIYTEEFNLSITKGFIKYLRPNLAYINSLLENISYTDISNKNLKVAIYGTDIYYLDTIKIVLNALNITVIAIKPDELDSEQEYFSNRLSDINKCITINDCHLGVLLAEDNKNLLVLDDVGQVLTKDKIATLLYYYFLKYKQWHGCIVKDMSSSLLLDKIADNFNENIYTVPVGHFYVLNKVYQTGAIMGVQSNENVFIRHNLLSEDSIYSVILLLEMVSKTGENITALWKTIQNRYGKYHVIDENFYVNDEKKLKMETFFFEDKFLPYFFSPIKKISYIDGCKIFFQNNDWVNIRFSKINYNTVNIIGEVSNLFDAALIMNSFKHFVNL